MLFYVTFDYQLGPGVQAALRVEATTGTEAREIATKALHGTAYDGAHPVKIMPEVIVGL